MIYVKDSDIKEIEFTNLLERARVRILGQLLKSNLSDYGPIEFESLVYQAMVTESIGTVFESHLIHTGDMAFPDIIAKKYFGIEVKVTTGDKWTSIGNSVLETTRVEGVERIYMFFGKLGGQPDIKFRPYQECLPDVAVTHYPRYKIDMLLPVGQSIFDKMGTNYDTLRKNPIPTIKNYYKAGLTEGEELWWIDSQQGVSPVIKPYSNLSAEDKDNFLIESMILFPEIFGSSPVKFERPAAYLITKYGAVCSNLRDIFTAGGVVNLTLENKLVKGVPRIVGKLASHASKINSIIVTLTEEELKTYWRVDKIPDDRLKFWLRLLRERASFARRGISIVDIFSNGQ